MTLLAATDVILGNSFLLEGDWYLWPQLWLCCLLRPLNRKLDSVVLDSLRPHGLQLARPPCPSPAPRVYSNSCPLSRWCHPTISSSVIPCSSCLQTFPASGLLQWVSSLHQVAKGLDTSFSISPSNEYSGLISFRMDCLDLLATQGTLKSLLQHHSSKASILQHSAFFIVQLSQSIHDYWKNHSFD